MFICIYDHIDLEKIKCECKTKVASDLMSVRNAIDEREKEMFESIDQIYDYKAKTLTKKIQHLEGQIKELNKVKYNKTITCTHFVFNHKLL